MNRFGVIPKGHNSGKWRLITDLSFSPGGSVNDGIDAAFCSMAYITVEDLEFDDVIWSDECSVQLESHRKVTYRKESQPSKIVSRPKHPPKVHVWGGISARGATAVVIFNCHPVH